MPNLDAVAKRPQNSYYGRTIDDGHQVSGSRLRQHLAHLLVKHVDRLERPHHHLEMGDLAGMVPGDHVDAVDLDAIDDIFEPAA